MRIIFLFSFLFTALLLNAQEKESSFVLVKDYTGDIVNATMDHMQNLYLISSGGSIKKLNAQGDSTGFFNGVRNYGKLTSIDVSNPLKVLLFYRDFSTVVILDRFLTFRTSIDLRKHNVLQPTAIGLSYDNNIWVFDQYDSKLKKLDEQKNQLVETTDLRNVFSHSISPQQIINEGGFVYLADSAQGIFIFDNYGAFRKKIEVKGWSSLSVKNSDIIRTQKDQLLLYQPALFSDKATTFPSSFAPFLHAAVFPDHVLMFDKDRLRIYRFRL